MARIGLVGLGHIGGAIAKANEFDIKLSIAVVDEGGRLVAFARMDGAIWAGVYGSQGKAVTSASFGRPSGVLMNMADLPIFRGIQEAGGVSPREMWSTFNMGIGMALVCRRRDADRLVRAIRRSGIPARTIGRIERTRPS